MIEVVISMMLIAVMATSLFTVTLSTKADTGREDRQVVATQASKEITAALRNFVTACCDPGSGTCCVGPGNCGTIPTCYNVGVNKAVAGPNTCNAGLAGWSFNGFPLNGSCGATAVADSDGTYALHAGQHTLTNVFPVWFSDPTGPYKATISYTVTTTPGVGDQTIPAVRVDVLWTEPKGP